DGEAQLARRALLGSVGLAGLGGIVAAVLGATGNGNPPPSVSQAPTRQPGRTGLPTPAVEASHDATHAPVAGTAVDHAANAAALVKRFVEGEWLKAPAYGNQPFSPRIDGDTKVFELSIQKIKHRLDALKDPIDALGYGGTWPGPLVRATA